MYELTEQRLPFGEDPRFVDHKAEWRRPKGFYTDDGKKDDALDSLVKGLLEWRPDKRLGGGKHAGTAAASADVKSHKCACATPPIFHKPLNDGGRMLKQRHPLAGTGSRPSGTS